VEHRRQPGPEEVVIVDDQHPDLLPRTVAGPCHMWNVPRQLEPRKLRANPSVH
jgi:hypothetical protein